MAAGKYDPSRPSFVAQFSDAMHSSVKAFGETDFTIDLCLGKLDFVGVHQLCCDSEFGDHALSFSARDI